ncbi:MAG: hypothetical protein Q9220_007334 [cf. Caloplaca sp. 1 TL-2023]
MSFDHDDLFPPHDTVSMAALASTPAPSSCDGREEEGDKKPAKKRKSWGQELPTPKTNLPPRKRAKTEDEKEQRRIERVLRNRQAAQSSRERKRQEVEKLEGEKSAIEIQNDMLKERLLAVEHEKFKLQQQVSRMTAELAALRNGTPHVPSTSPSDVDLLNNQRAIKQEFEDSIFALRTPVSLPSDSFSPSSSAYTESRSPSPSSFDLGFHHLNPTPDMTQHPAAMLCDLQCQSGVATCSATMDPSSKESTTNLSNIPSNTQSSFLQTVSTMVYWQLLLPLLQISLSLKTNSPLPTNLLTTPTSLRLIRWLILTPANPTTTATTTAATTSASAPTTRPHSKPTYRLNLLRRLLLCSPALARPLLGATVRAMRAECRKALKARKMQDCGTVESKKETSWEQLMVLAFAIGCIGKEIESKRMCNNTKDRDLGREKQKTCTMALEERG